MSSIIQAYNFILNWDHQSSPALLTAIRTVLSSSSEEFIRPLHNCLQAIAEKTNSGKATFFGVPIHAIDNQGRALIGALDRLRVVHYSHFSASQSPDAASGVNVVDVSEMLENEASVQDIGSTGVKEALSQVILANPTTDTQSIQA